MVQLLMLGGAVIAGIIVIGIVAKLVGIVIMLAIWMLAGHVGAKLVRGESYGMIGDTALGFGGGILGGVVLAIVGMGTSGLIGGLLGGVVGAMIIVWFLERKKGNSGASSNNVKISV